MSSLEKGVDMREIEWMRQIERTYSKERVPFLISAVQQDELVWKAIMGGDLADRILLNGGKEISCWLPVSVFLEDIQEPLTVSELKSQPILPIESRLQKIAIKQYEEIFREACAPKNLREAGLVALALRERRRLKNSWSGLVQELLGWDSNKQPVKIRQWKTVLVCLYGMVPDGNDLLRGIYSALQSDDAKKLILHVLLANSLDQETLINRISAFLIDIGESNPSLWLRQLISFGRKELASELAGTILMLRSKRANDKPNFTNLTSQATRVVELQEKAALLAISGAKEDANTHWKQTCQEIEYWQKSVIIQDIENRRGTISREEAAQLLQNFEDDQNQRWELCMQLPNLSGAVLNETATDEIPPVLLLKLYLADYLQEKSENSLARVQKSLLDLKKLVAVGESIYESESDLDWHPEDIFEQFLAANLFSEAAEFGEIVSKERKNNPQILLALSNAYQKTGELDSALKFAQKTCLLSPLQADSWRFYGGLLQDNKEWEEAFKAFKEVVELETRERLSDWLALAQCAYQTNRLESAIDAAEHALSIDGQNGSAHLSLGLAKLASGEPAQGIEHLTTATLVMPEDAEPWLKLYEAYEYSGQSQKALETLRSAALAVPESAEVNFKLAKAYQRNQDFSEALPFLKKAASLSPQVAEMAVQLGETLYQLGYIAEAETVLQESRSKWPADSQIAYAFAKTLIAQGRKNEAIIPLEIAVKAKDAPIEWFKYYADTLVADKDLVLGREDSFDYAHLVNAKQALEKVLDLMPNDHDASRVYAEVLLAKGEYEQALFAYQDILEKMDGDTGSLDWRIRTGFGKAALKLGKTDAALASLQTASQIQPTMPGVIQLLSEAYRAESLPKEAMKEAQRALKLFPNDPDMLIWFARMALILGDHDAAIQTLKCLTELRPEKSHFWVELAGIQVEVGRLEEAKRTLNLMLSHETVNLEGFKKAARLFLQIKEYKQAAFCIERAVLINKSQDAELLFVLGCTEYLVGDYKSALEHVQTCSETQSDWINLFVLESDILKKMGRHQASEACLDQALKLLENQTDQPFEDDSLIFALPAEFVQAISLPEYAYLRKAEACLEQADLVSFEGYLSQILAINPKWMAVRMSLIEHKRSHMQNDQAYKLIEEGLQIPFEQVTDLDRRWWIECVCAKAEIHLDREDLQGAAQCLQTALTYNPENPRVMAIQSRVLSLKGEIKSAEALFLSAERGLEGEFGEDLSLAWFELHTPQVAKRLDCWRLWMSQAAQDNRLWEKGFQWLNELVSEFPQNCAAQFELAKNIIISLEEAELSRDLNCVNHAPVIDLQDPIYQIAFDQAIKVLKNNPLFIGPDSLDELGKALIKPTTDSIKRAVATMRNMSYESGLVGLLRHQGNTAGAQQISLKLPETIRNIIQMSFCHSESDPETGINLLEKWVITQPNNPLVWAAQAKLCAYGAQPEKALENIKKALVIWDDEPEWHAFAARMAEKIGDVDQAMRCWENAILITPHNYSYRLSLANLFNLKQLPAKVIETLEPIAENISNLPELWSLYAKAYWQMRNFDRALTSAQKAVKLEPDCAKHYLLVGQIAKQIGNQKLALDMGVQAFSIEHCDLNVTLFVSQLYSEMGEDEKALKVIERSSAQVQQTAIALFERAKLIRKIYGAEVALPLLDELIAKDPKNVEVIAMKAELLSEIGDFKNAEKTAIEALQIDPRQSKLNLLVGRIKHHVGQLDQAVQYLSEAIRQNVYEIEAYLELGTTYQERREFGKAIHIYQQAIKVSPDDYRPYFNAGLILRESKDYVEAETMLRKAAELAPDNVNIRRQLGAIVALNLVHNSSDVSRNL